MTHGKCKFCHRTFRSAASKTLAENRSAILADLRLTYTAGDLSKHVRHVAESQEFRQKGAH